MIVASFGLYTAISAMIMVLGFGLVVLAGG